MINEQRCLTPPKENPNILSPSVRPIRIGLFPLQLLWHKTLDRYHSLSDMNKWKQSDQLNESYRLRAELLFSVVLVTGQQCRPLNLCWNVLYPVLQTKLLTSPLSLQQKKRADIDHFWKAIGFTSEINCFDCFNSN